MKQRENRRLELAERASAAKRVLDDENVMAWFADREALLIRQMLDAPVSDDETRRISTLEIKVIQGLISHLERDAGAARRNQDHQKRIAANE